MVKRRTSTPVPDVAGLPGDTLIDAAHAVALIASRTGKPHDDERTARDRVRKLLKDWVKKGKLSEAKPGQFRLNELGHKLRIKWPGKFDNVPADINVEAKLEGQAITTSSAAVSARAIALPADLAECHRRIDEYDATVVRLEGELRAAQEKIRDLEPDAQKQRDRVAKARSAGRQGGRGNAK